MYAIVDGVGIDGHGAIAFQGATVEDTGTRVQGGILDGKKVPFERRGAPQSRGIPYLPKHFGDSNRTAIDRRDGWITRLGKYAPDLEDECRGGVIHVVACERSRQSSRGREVLDPCMTVSPPNSRSAIPRLAVMTVASLCASTESI